MGGGPWEGDEADAVIARFIQEVQPACKRDRDLMDAEEQVEVQEHQTREARNFTSYGVDGGLSPFYWFARCIDGSWDTVGADVNQFYWGGENGCPTREEALARAKLYKERYPGASIMVAENVQG
jgi:hypothetical protein